MATWRHAVRPDRSPKRRIVEQATGITFNLWAPLASAHICRFNDGWDHWCYDADHELCDQDCEMCALCNNYGPPKSKLRVYANYLADSGVDSTREGFRRSASENTKAVSRRMED